MASSPRLQNQLSPDIQKLILDVFTQKFSQTDQNTKVTSNETDSINPLLNVQTIKTASNVTIIAIFESGNTSGSGTNPQSLTPQGLLLSHVPGPPQMQIFDTHAVQTTSFTAVDNFGFNTIGGNVAFQDINVGDRPTVSASIASFVYVNAQGQTVTPNAQQMAAIQAAEGSLSFFPNAGSTNNGSTNFIYNLPDSMLSFLGAGEKLVLTYNVTVTNNFAGNPELVMRPITITILGTPGEIWIHTSADGHDNLWTTGQNWKTGHAPLSTDDVFIVTDQANGGALSYPAIIDGGTHAVANSLMMDDHGPPGANPPRLEIDAGGSLKIGTTITLNADSELNNAGLLQLGTGGVFQGAQNLGEGGARIVNSGTIEVQSGPLEVFVDVANSNGETGGNIVVDEGATLALGSELLPGNTVGFGNITGGTVTVNGTLDLQGGNFLSGGTLINNGQINVTGLGNALHGETVTANHALEIFGESALTIDQGSDVTNAALTVDDSALLTVNGSIIRGGLIANSPGGEIDLTGTATLQGGALDNQSNVNVSGTGNVFDKETVINNGTGLKAIDITGTLTLQNGSSITNLSGNGETVESGASLTLSDTSFIKNGTLDNLGTVFVEASAGAALHGVIVDNTGAIYVDMSGSVPATLILDSGTKVSGGTIDIGDVGTLEVGLGGATLSGVLVAVTVDGGGTGVVQVDDGQIMTLTGTTIDGGTINDLGTIDVTGITSRIDQGAQLNGGTVTAEAKLTLDSVTVSSTTITDNGGGVETDGTVKLTGGATIQGLSAYAGKITNNGTLEIAGVASLLNDTVANAGQTVQVDAPGTLTLAGTEIQGGTITDDGKIEVSGDSKIDSGAVLTGGGVTVDANLTLDNVTVSGTKVTIDSLIGDSVIIGETVQLEGGATLAGLSPYAGKITNNGTLEIVDTASLLNDTVSNGSGVVTIDGPGTLTLAGTEIKGGTISDLGKIEVKGSSKIDQNAILNNGGVTVDANQTLTLDNVTVNGTTFTDTAAGATLTVDDGAKLTLSHVTIDGGTVNDGTAAGTNGKFGAIEIQASSRIDQNAILNNGGVTIDSGQTLTLDNVTVNGTTFTDTAAGATLTVDDGAKLTLSHVTIDGGTINDGTSTGGTIEIQGFEQDRSAERRSEQWRGDDRRRPDADAGQRDGERHDVHGHGRRRDAENWTIARR